MAKAAAVPVRICAVPSVRVVKLAHLSGPLIYARNGQTKRQLRDSSLRIVYKGPMIEPSSRKLAGIALIVALIVGWAAFVASLAPFVGRWSVLAQAPYYLVMGLAWIIPLKPLIRWAETGSFRGPSTPHN
jgi:Protein of unknown function (DUF2842)